MNHIYIVFSKTGTWLSNSIGVLTKSDYTHVALSFDENFDNMYTFGRLNPKNPFLGGLTTESIHKGVYNKSKVKCLIYKIPVSDKQLRLLKKELTLYLNSSTKYKYNFLGLFGAWVDKPMIRKDYYFCSQFVTTLLEKSTIWNSPKVPEITRPSDLETISNKEILYQGPVFDFPHYKTTNLPITHKVREKNKYALYLSRLLG